MSHVCVMTTAEPGLDICIECERLEPNPTTAIDHQLEECGCGRGLARFVDHDGTAWCASCFSERVDARRKVVV